MKALREKYPRGTLIQCRIMLDGGSVVEYEGALGSRGSYFDRTLEAARNANEGQETASLPSAGSNEQKHEGGT